MKILCCVKRVPITGGKMVLTDDAQSLETRHLGFTISPHEECAVEEAVRIVEAGGGEVVVLTLGPPEAEEQLRDCMAIGADRGILLRTDEEWDPQATAAAIVDAVRDESFDLLLFGNESADAGNYQVAIRVAYALALPVVTGLKKIELQNGHARVERDVGGARDVYETQLPAVLTVLEGLNLPRYPSVPGRLRAKSKPLETRDVSRPEPKLEKLRLAVPEGQGKQAEILGTGADAAPRVVEVLQQLGVA
jgi:electron transfer flavoprotein beta subunit